MKRWPLLLLREIADIEGGSTPRREVAEYWNGDIPWVTPTDLPMPGDGIADVSATKDYLTQKGFESCSAKVLPVGTVLFSSRATIGKLGIAEVPLTTNQGFANFKPRENASPKFLAYALWFFTPDISRLAGSTTFREVTKGNLRNFKIPVPPLPEQERLARLLDEADALRRLRARADARTADFIPALFHEMFGDPARNHKGWPVVAVSSFVREFQGGRSVLSDGSETPESKYRVLKVSAATWREYRPEESKPVPPDYTPQEAHLVRTGDLLFSRANTTELVGATVYVFDTPPNMLLPDKLWRFVWQEPRAVEPLFVWALFLHPSTRRELGQRATGTSGSMKNISMPKVLSMRVPLPSLPLQREFAARVSEARALEEMQAQSKARLDALFESMLARAFAGEL